MLTIKPLHPNEYIAFLEKTTLGNFMQYPSWAKVKSEWTSDLIGWHTQENELVGCALILYRKVPYLNRYLAYIPRGPIFDWQPENLQACFMPLFSFLKTKRVFTVKMDPPVVQAKWSTPLIKDFLEQIRQDGLSGKELRDLKPDLEFQTSLDLQRQLISLGWKKSPHGKGFSAAQPDYVFRLPLEGISLDELFAKFHTNWKRNVKKAERLGVKVRIGSEADLPAFYDLLQVTSARDNFKVRSYTYFENMYKALKAEHPQRIFLYLAEDDEELLSATLAVHSNRHTWYLYGASSNNKREKAPNHAIQWQMIKDAHTRGDRIYDFRGISPTLDEADALFGLLRFKLGFSGEACEMLGAWDYTLNPLLDKAFNFYMNRR